MSSDFFASQTLQTRMITGKIAGLLKLYNNVASPFANVTDDVCLLHKNQHKNCGKTTMRSIQKSLEVTCSAGVTQFSECLGFYLSDSFSCDVEFLSYLLESTRSAVIESEAELYHVLLTGGKRMKLLFNYLAQYRS